MGADVMQGKYTKKFEIKEEYDLNFIRRVAYDTLVKFNYNSLPTRLHTIMQQEIGVLNYYTYEVAARKFNTPISYLLDIFGDNGFLGYDSEYSVFNIFINTKTDKKLRMKAIAISLAYIELFAKPYPNEWIPLLDDNDYIYEFTTTLLAPDIILEKCGFYKNTDIMEHTYLSFRDALYKERQLKENKHFSDIIECLSEIEHIMLHNYRKFIARHKGKAHE